MRLFKKQRAVGPILPGLTNVHARQLDELVAAKVGAYFGNYRHPVSKKGRLLKDRVVDPATGEILRHGIPINELARSTSHPEDALVYAPLYAFLSEFVHVHMIASGSYRSTDGRRYVTSSDHRGEYPATLPQRTLRGLWRQR